MNEIVLRIPKQTNYFDMFMITTMLFPIFTVTAGLDSLNKVLFGLLLVIYCFTTIQQGLSRASIIWVMLLIVNLAFAVYQTQFPMANLNLLFYYPFFTIYSLFAIDFKDKIIDFFHRYKDLVLLVMRFWTLLVGVSIFLPSSYYIKEAGESYFGSYVGSIFRLGPAAIFIMGLSMISMSIYERKWDIIFSAVPLYSFFSGSSRTYLVLGICIFAIQWYWFVGKKKIYYLTIIPIGMLTLGVIFLTPIGDKILHTLDDSNYGDFWFRITNSRSLLWANLFTALREEPLQNLIFGSGIEYSARTINHWAHNDFIELICSFGYCGMGQYTITMFMCYKKFFTTKYRIPIVVILSIFMVWFFNAFFNMHYVYFCATLAYPIILIAISQYYDKNKVE